VALARALRVALARALRVLLARALRVALARLQPNLRLDVEWSPGSGESER